MTEKQTLQIIGPFYACNTCAEEPEDFGVVSPERLRVWNGWLWCDAHWDETIMGVPWSEALVFDPLKAGPRS